MFKIDNVHFVLGLSESMQNVHQLGLRASRSDLPVMITGETGVGKESLARFIHYQSHRKNSPFLKINCAALSPQLIESELFGHEKGAFTGAETIRLGRFELANHGTILLDEINEISPQLQPKLLQVIEDKCFERVGSSFSQKIDTRIIATCNQDLKVLVKRGAFRPDLYYRLNVIPIHIESLRKRKEDIIPLVTDFLERNSGNLTSRNKKIDVETIRVLMDYPWPGNVRELFNLLLRIMALSDNTDECILPKHITCFLDKNSIEAPDLKSSLAGLPLAALEKETIQATICHFNGNQHRAAECLGISDRTLRNKIRNYAIAIER